MESLGAQICARYNLFLEAASECEGRINVVTQNINLLKWSIAQYWCRVI